MKAPKTLVPKKLASSAQERKSMRNAVDDRTRVVRPANRRQYVARILGGRRNAPRLGRAVRSPHMSIRT